jgi:hypothetical protein
MRRVVPGGVVALLLCASFAGAAIPRPGHFDGTTSQVYPDGSLGTVAIKMTHGGRRLRSFDIIWLAACDSGFTTLSQGTHAQGTVNDQGGFRGDGTYRSDQGNLAGTPYTATVTDHLRGRFESRKAARGTFQATVVLHDRSGTAVSTCTSPSLRWSAQRR